MKRPNVVLLYTDQQRWDTLRCAGNPHIHTPNLDALAARGMLFENAFCNSPVCMPSRQSMLSGLYPSVTGTTCNGIEMPESIPCLHNILGQYGYHTAQIGKLHFKNHSNRDHREIHPSYGFDTMILSDEPGCYDDAYIKWVQEHDPTQVEACRCMTPPAYDGVKYGSHPRGTATPYVFDGPEELTHTAFVAEESAQFIHDHADERFFLISGFYAPHAPINPPQRFVDMYDIDAMPLPFMNPGEDTRFQLGDDGWGKVVAYYYALITHIDDQIGRILGALRETGLEDDTLVIFTADHGEHLGDHGLVAKGAPGLDSCAHVPLIMSCPERFAVGTRPELVEAVDVTPTVLDYCGIQVPPEMQGRSLRPLMEGRETSPRKSVFIEHRYPFRESWKTVRTLHHKYCVCNDGRELLFDLLKDPHELADVSDDPRQADALHAMRNEMVKRWFDVEKQLPRRTGMY